MRRGRKVETRRDRKALARDAGMGRISPLSVLAGALCGLAAVEALAAIAAAVIVVVNGGTTFSSWSTSQFKTVAGVVGAVVMFAGFMLAGYVSGRMSRRSGALHGLLAGVAGVVLAAVVVAAVEAGGADNALARVATHIGVADTWQQWRTFALIGAAVAAAAMVLAGLAGGAAGETWHGKLLDRAVDPTFGPEAEERAEARKRSTAAEVARLKAANDVGRVTATSRATRSDDTVTEPVPTAPPVRTATGAVLTRSTHGSPVAEETATETATGSRRHRPRHLLGRR